MKISLNFALPSPKTQVELSFDQKLTNDPTNVLEKYEIVYKFLFKFIQKKKKIVWNGIHQGFILL